MGKFKKFTSEQIEYIKENFDKFTYEELTKNFNKHFNENRRVSTINNKAIKLGLSKGKKRTILRYTQEQEQWLKNNAHKYYRQELVEKFNEKFHTNQNYNSINKKCVQLKARGKTIDDYHKDYGSWNKGIKGKEYWEHFSNKEKQLDFLRTVNCRYKAHDIVIRKDRKDYRPYIVLSEEDKKVHKNLAGIIPLARFVYEKKLGRPLKSNEYVLHLDGDITNCEIDNLYLVNKSVACILFKEQWNRIKNKNIMKVAIKHCEMKATIKEVANEN